MQVDRGLKIGIISSLVATFIFLYFLEPLGNLLLSAGKIGFQTYIDRIYKEVATQDLDLPFMIIYGFIVFFLMGFILDFFSGAIKILKKYLRKEEPEKTDNKKEISRDIKENESPKKKGKIMKVVFPSILFILLLSMIIDISIKKKAISSFNQHIRVLAPYISEEEKKFIISDFSTMKSQNDYRKIQEKLQGIAKKNDVELPENYQYIW